MMTATQSIRKFLPMTILPQASVVIGGRLFPAEIRSAAFHGGVLETQAKVEEGSLVPLKLSGETPTTVHIHVLEVSEGKMVFRLYGTQGRARLVWDEMVNEVRRSIG